MREGIHYPIPDTLYHERFHKSLFRPVLCRAGSDFLCLDIEHKKQKREPTDMYMFQFKEKRGFDFGESWQAYYTRNIDDVTCKGCRNVIERLQQKDIDVLNDKLIIHIKRMEQSEKTRQALRRHIKHCTEQIQELKAQIYDARSEIVKVTGSYAHNQERARRLNWGIEVKKSLSSSLRSPPKDPA